MTTATKPKQNPRCQVCYERESYSEPWMPPATCCECGKTVCKECLEPSFIEEFGSYVCRLCSVTVYGNAPEWDKGLLNVSSEGEISMDGILIPSGDDEMKQFLTEDQIILIKQHDLLRELFHTARFRFYAQILPDGTKHLDLETEFIYPVEPATEEWWVNLYQVAHDTGCREVEVMDEYVNSDVTTNGTTGEKTYHEWHGKKVKQVALWYDVLSLTPDQVKAKIEELREATATIWKEAGMEVY